MSASTPFRDALRAYRARMGLTQAALAERWGVTVTTISRWERGDRAVILEGPIRRLMALDRK